MHKNFSLYVIFFISFIRKICHHPIKYNTKQLYLRSKERRKLFPSVSKKQKAGFFPLKISYSLPASTRFSVITGPFRIIERDGA